MQELVLDSFDLDKKYTEAIEREISSYFQKEIYQPILEELNEYALSTRISNSIDDLLIAIHKGQITFYRGHFKGRFNAKISKELKKLGAKWSKKNGGSFKLPTAKLPREVDMAIRTSEASWTRAIEKIQRKIQDTIEKSKAIQVDFTEIVGKAVSSMDSSFDESLQGLVLVPKLSEQNIKDIAEKYTTNMNYYIKNFEQEEIVKLREVVSTNVFEGHRYESLAKKIKKSYGVSQSKATFLARQETNLLVAQFKESRYNEVGIDEYEWQTVLGSPASPVRESHAKLNGTRQRFSNPPVVNEKGDRKNPGQDFGCRCRAKPVIRF